MNHLEKIGNFLMIIQNAFYEKYMKISLLNIISCILSLNLNQTSSNSDYNQLRTITLAMHTDLTLLFWFGAQLLS